MIDIYIASVKNVRELKKQRISLKRLFNKSILANDHSSFSALTKMYALLYSAFAEVCFLKCINTPYGFNADEIRQIKKDTNNRERNLEQKWGKSLELAFLKINNLSNTGEIQNKKLIYNRLVNQYIIEPSQLRNKIAHGQWLVALNSESTAINTETSKKISQLDFVQIDIHFDIYEKIGQVLEDLIESPHKAHFNNFYNHITELQELVNRTNSWSLTSKISKLKETQERQRKIIENRTKKTSH